MPYANLLTLNFYTHTDLNTAFVSNSFKLYCHFSGPPRLLRSEKNSSMSIKNEVLRYSGSTSISALNKPMSLISTSSSQYRIRKALD